jgi:integrase
MKLNELKCKSAKPSAKSYKLFDGAGLYLEVMPGGSKHWRYKYYQGGKEKRLSFGRYPALPLKVAREKLLEVKTKMERGEPLEPAAPQVAVTFASLAEEWLTCKQPGWSQNTYNICVARLRLHIFPRIGDMPLQEVRPLTILELMNALKAAGAPETARRCRQVCDAVFRYGMVTERTEHNPAATIRGMMAMGGKKHMAAFDKTALPAFLANLRGNKARLYPQTIAAIQLLLHTFVRTGELIGARWDEFDLEQAQWLIPASRMKMKRAHVVPLSRQVIDIIEGLRLLRVSEYLLPSPNRAGQPVSNCIVLMALRRMGYGGIMTGHGFRSLAKTTILEDLPGYTEDIIERQLAHAPRGAYGEAYNRAHYLPQRREMMQAWADYIFRL